MSEPWKNWIPGVLSDEQIRELLRQGYIRNVNEKAIDYSAMDLTLADEGYIMVSGSVKPVSDRYEHLILSQKLATRLDKDNDGAYVLKRTKTYLFKIYEQLNFKKEASIYGQATAKSTIGRMDVLARLIVDGMDQYEGFTPEGLEKGRGEMYLEITPMTFNVRVKPGISLSQLRLFRGRPKDVEIHSKELFEPVLHYEDREMDGSLSVNLEPAKISGIDVCAFCANRMEEKDEAVDLWENERGEKPLPCKYWKFLKSDSNGRLRINKSHFYILRSKERISLPGGVAVYCRATDETIGEMRIHYAGFVHPFFGMGRTDEAIGTPLIFEVRGHDVDISLKDGEKMAKLIFYRMSNPCQKVPKTDTKDTQINTERKGVYNEQSLQLSKIFAKWPDKINVAADGTVNMS